MTPALIVEKHAQDAGAAAVELVRRFNGTRELETAARLWCDRFGGQGHTFDGRIDDPHAPSRCAHALLTEALRHHVPLEEWVRRARRTEFLRGARRDAEVFDGPLIAAVLVAWPHRDDLTAMPNALQDWAREQSNRDPAQVAKTLYDYPDVAFALLGPVQYVPPAGPCTGCGQHPRDIRDTGYSHLALVLERRRHQVPDDPRDDEVVQGIPAHALLREPWLRLLIRRWLSEGRDTPTERLWLAVEEALEARDSRWWNAVSLLIAGSEEHRTRGVQSLTDVVRSIGEPGQVLEALGRDMPMSRNIFSGRGWGRDNRRKRLCGLARAFLERGVWPTQDWLHCLEQEEPPRETEEECAERLEARFEAVREILAEGLLSFALDEKAPDAIRYRAIEAIERLRPGGDGSVVRALSKIKTRGIKEKAQSAQHRLSRTRGSLTDAEFCIEDALAVILTRS